MKSYIKKKAGPKAGPGYRTPKNFRGKILVGKRQTSQTKFNQSRFKVQHKG
ncbi:MAG: hypothetical protein WBD86_00545 [Microgenomates group bacterium]